MKDETLVTHMADLEQAAEKFPALSFMGGPSMGQIIVLKEGEHIVGRSQKATIVVHDDAISRQHFKISVQGNQATLEDLESTNGTYVNGIRVKRHVLKDKDTVQISSQTIMTFSYFSDLEVQKQTQVYRMANFDPVTQARTKYYFLDQIEKEFSHALRRKDSLSLIIYDIDFFKKVNDNYGHPAGDYVLKRVADLTQQVVRSEDLFARYGGEEFVILMRDSREQEAIRLAERLRQLIALTPFEFEGERIKVTISAGVSCLQEGNFKNFEEMIKTADDYLYFAKENGRNQIASYEVLLNRKEAQKEP